MVTKKIILLSFLFFCFTNINAQLVYLGDDEGDKKYDDYQLNKLCGGLVQQGNNYYFTTPNGHFFKTDGTAENTKVISNFSGNAGIFLGATNKFIYLSINVNGRGNVVQYNPAANTFNTQLYVKDPYEIFSLCGVVVPDGSKQTIDELFVSPDKSKNFFRTFKNDKFRIYAIHDDAPSKVIMIKEGYMPTTEHPDVVIGVGCKLGFVRNEVFFNGRIKKASMGVYETSISSYEPKADNATDYEFKSDYRLLEKKILNNEKLLQTPTSIFTLAQRQDNDGKQQLLEYSTKNANFTKTNLAYKADDYSADVLDEQIYVSCKGKISLYNEKKQDYYYVFNDEKSIWSNINPTGRFLKSNDYILYKSGDGLGVINTYNGAAKSIKTPVLINEPNKYDAGSVYAYAGKYGFYFIDYADGKNIFTQYNPLENLYTATIFPEFNKETYKEIRGIFQQRDHFLILTAYTGKKGKIIYKMFIYKEKFNGNFG